MLSLHCVHEHKFSIIERSNCFNLIFNLHTRAHAHTQKEKKINWLNQIKIVDVSVPFSCDITLQQITENCVPPLRMRYAVSASYEELR